MQEPESSSRCTPSVFNREEWWHGTYGTGTGRPHVAQVVIVAIHGLPPYKNTPYKNVGPSGAENLPGSPKNA